MSSEPAGVVERYLRALTGHDWSALADCLADDVVRVGPYGDTYPSKAEYLAFLSDLMPKLQDYLMDVARVTYTPDGGAAYAELAETMTHDGRLLRTNECLTFALSPDGRITRIDVFIQTPTPGA
jgi:ketosteroid isomerase-like protein